MRRHDEYWVQEAALILDTFWPVVEKQLTIAEGKWTKSGDLLGASFSELRAVQLARDSIATLSERLGMK